MKETCGAKAKELSISTTSFFRITKTSYKFYQSTDCSSLTCFWRPQYSSRNEFHHLETSGSSVSKADTIAYFSKLLNKYERLFVMDLTRKQFSGHSLAESWSKPIWSPGHRGKKCFAFTLCFVFTENMKKCVSCQLWHLYPIFIEFNSKVEDNAN